MAVPKIAINGFGRIGRIVTRIAKMRRHFDVVAINDLTDPEHLAYLFKYDSVHGVYPGAVRLDGDTMVIDNDPFQVLSERDPAKLPWRALGVDYVIDSTGKFLRIHELQYQEEPIVSTDVVGNSHSSIFDPALTQVMDETFVKVIAWYDNEWGYSARVEELIGRLAAFDGMTSDFRK
jgi:glyceraldehyde-3-phosphate dehydrogenase/erythrose-4-phosphate dehydrogenase